MASDKQRGKIIVTAEQWVATILAGSALTEGGAFAWMVYRARARGYGLRWLGWGQGTNAAGMLAGLMVAALYCAWSVGGVAGLWDDVLRFGALKLLALAAAGAAALFEETLFRGLLMNRMRARGRSAFAQVVVSGLAFGAAHGLWGLMAPGYTLGFMVATTALGLALACVFLLGRRSLTPVILSHFLIDAVLEPWLLLHVFQAGR
ncbi:MAG: CPBP family intramembrane glutamic endopeptidase [Acidobacteriota bacterium]